MAAQNRTGVAASGWGALGDVLLQVGQLRRFFVPYLPLAGGVALLVFFSADLQLLVASLGQKLVNSFIGGAEVVGEVVPLEERVDSGSGFLMSRVGEWLTQRSSVGGLIAAMAVLLLGVQGLAIGIEQLRTRISLAFRTRLQASLMAALLRDRGASRNARDAATTRMIFAQDAGGLGSFLIFGLLGFLEQGLRLVLYSAGLWQMADGRGWLLVAVFVPATVLIHFIVQSVFLKKEMAASLENQQAMMANHSSSIGFFNVMNRLVYLRGEAGPAQALLKESESAGQANRRYQLVTSLKNSVSMILVTLAVPMIFLLAVLMKMGSPGEVIQAQMIVALVTAAVGSMMSFPGMLAQYAQPLKRVIEVLDTPSPGAEPEEMAVLKEKTDALSFSVTDLCFSYPESDEPLLEGVTFDVPAGSLVGIVGGSGSGKSTLARLFIGEWQADSGTVSLDGKDVTDWHMWHRRQLIGYLPAEQGFLKDSLQENVLFGQDHPGDQRLAEVMEACGLREKWKNLGERPLESVSEHLSTGEQRRVGVARMLCGDHPVRIFDEPVANLDGRNMMAVAAAIQQTAKGRTVLVITHDPEFFETDFNVFLQDGRVKATGTHEELLAKESAYADLLQHFQRQREEAWRIE